MPVTSKVAESECKLYIMVSAASMAQESDMTAILDDLETALSHLESHLPDRDLYYYQICLEIDGIPPAQGAYKGEAMGDEAHNPWTSFCPAFWSKIVTVPSLQERVDAFLNRFQNIFRTAAKKSSITLCEGDETQLGEPLLAHLALTDVRFISRYIAFLRLWDLGHDVQISGAVHEILSEHGYGEETDALLSCTLFEVWVQQHVSWFLEAAFDGQREEVVETTLFLRLVTMFYASSLQMAARSCEGFQLDLTYRRKDGPPSLPDLSYQAYFDPDTIYRQAEDRIVAILQKQHFPVSGTKGDAEDGSKDKRAGWSIGRFLGK